MNFRSPVIRRQGEQSRCGSGYSRPTGCFTRIATLIVSATIVGRIAGIALHATPREAATAFVDSLPAYTATEHVSGRIVMWGHGSAKRDFMGDLLERWARAFARQQPDVAFENRMYGTSSAIAALSVGAGNLAILGEEINPDAKREFERAKGYAPTGIAVATGSLDVAYYDYAHMIFVHRDNPLAQLTVPQLEAVFGAEHKLGDRNIRTWGELGVTGEWANRPIQPYAWKLDEDFALFFRERVLGNSHHWNPAIREFETKKRPDGTSYEHGQQILEALAKDRYGIAISTVRFASPDVKMLALADRPGGPFVLPTEQTLVDQSYPLTRVIPVYVDRQPGGRIEPAVREFVRFILSRDGQQTLVEASGYLPLNASALAREREKLQ